MSEERDNGPFDWVPAEPSPREVIKVLESCPYCGQPTKIEHVLPARVEFVGDVVGRVCECQAAKQEHVRRLKKRIAEVEGQPRDKSYQVDGMLVTKDQYLELLRNMVEALK